MPHIHSSRPATAVLILLLTALALTACGSSSKGTSSTSASASTSTSTTGSGGGAKAAEGAVTGRFSVLRECLQKNGIKPPEGAPGQPPAAGLGGLLGGSGGPSLPKGMTQGQYQAILKKCGAHLFGGRGLRPRVPGIGTGLHSPAVAQAFAKFATCMREHGVDLPAPNTSGKGPIFNTKGIDTTGSAFRTAEMKCASPLQNAFRARPGAAGGASG